MTPYVPRRFDDAGLWSLGPVTAKAVTVVLDGEALPPGTLGAARAHAEAVLPEAARVEGEPTGQGLVVLHQGRQGTWLLMDWWAHGDILCGRLARAEVGGTAFAPMDGRPLLACVWEMVALDHERRAFRDHILAVHPDPAAWAADRLAPGLY